MPIDSSTTLTGVLLYMSTTRSTAIVIQAKNGSTTVATFRPTNNRWNVAGDSELTELDTRIENGTISVLYNYNGTTYNGLSAVPAYLRDAVQQRDPFIPVTSTTQGAEGPDIGPHTVFYYKRSSGETAPAVPDVSQYDGDANTIEILMDGSGWTPTVPTGTDPLYYTRITYSRTGGTGSAFASAPTTDDIRWSTDDGDTYTTTPPADNADIDSIQTYIAPYGWATQVVHDDLINPFRRLSAEYWQNGANGSTSYDHYVALPTDTALLLDNYQVGFLVLKRQSWSDTGTVVYGGEVEFNTGNLMLTYPDQMASQDANGQVGNSTYMMVMNKETGGFDHAGLCDPATLCSDYDSAFYATWKFVFLAFPKTRLDGAITADAGILTVDSGAGLAQNDILFIGDEQIRITSGNPATPDENGDYTVNVTRGVNGTTAAAHADNAQVRARVNRDEVEYIVFTHRHGVSTVTTMRFFFIAKRGAE